MDLASFEDHLDRYGGDIAAWPEAARPGAASLLTASAAARHAHDAMRGVETVLAMRVAHDGTVDAMAAMAMRHPQARPGRRLVVQAKWGAAAAAVLVLGLAVGTLAPRPHDESAERAIAAALEPAGSIDVD